MAKTHAILLDNTLRDNVTQFHNIYLKYKQLPDLEVDDTEHDLQTKYSMSDDEYADFKEEYAVELNAFAPEVKKFIVQAELTQLSYKTDLTVVAFGSSKEIPATLNFLAKCSCYVRNISFIRDADELASYDTIITSLPNILAKYPDKCIKIETLYNIDCSVERSYPDLKTYLETL